MSTYTVFVDGQSFDKGLKPSIAKPLAELLRDHFPNAVCVAVKEKKS